MPATPNHEAAQPNGPVALRRLDAPHCTVRLCSAVGVPLLDRFGGPLAMRRNPGFTFPRRIHEKMLQLNVF